MILTQIVVFVNATPVPLEFHWEILYEGDEIPRRINGKKSVFSIEPERGTLPAFERCEFSVSFKPTEVRRYTAFFFLCIDNVPIPKDHNHPYYYTLELEKFKNALSDSNESTDPVHFFEPPIQRKGKPLYIQDTQNNMQYGEIRTEYFRVSGIGKSFNINLIPPLIVFGSPLTIGNEVVRNFIMENSNPSEVYFSWEFTNENEFYKIDIHPKESKIEANSSLTITITFTPYFIGDFDEVFKCKILPSDSLSLNIKAKIRGPEVFIDTPAIDFGLVQVGKSISTTIKITNLSDIGVQYQFFSHSDSILDDNLKRFAFRPFGNFLEAKKSNIVTICYEPKQPEKLNEIIECRVAQGITRYISVRGQAQKPKIIISSTHVNLGTTYLDCSVQHKIQLTNLTFLQSKFVWIIDPIKLREAGYSLYFEPSSGIIEPSQTVDVIINFSPEKVGNFEILVPCFVDGMMDNPIGVLITGEAKGLSVSLSVKDIEEVAFDFCKTIVFNILERLEPENSRIYHLPKLDFGKVIVGKKKEITLKLRNHSGCLSFYAFSFEKHGAPLLHSRRKSSGVTVSFGSRSGPVSSSLGKPAQGGTLRPAISQRCVRTKQPLLAPKHEHEVYLSKKGKEFWKKKKKEENEALFTKEILQHGEGVAFDLSSMNGRLNGYQTLEIKATCYSNTCGVFHDKLKVEIVGLPTAYAEVKAEICNKL